MLNKRILIVSGCVVLFLIVMSVIISKARHAPVDTSVQPEMSVEELYDRAIALKKNNEIIKAREAYRSILSQYPDYKDIENIQKDLENLNMKIIFSNIQSSRSVMHEVKSGDTLGKLALEYGTTIDLIKINNRLSGDVIRIGQRLRIWTGQFNILVDKSQNVLLLKNNDEVMKVYQVSTGEENSTPIGNFKITSRLIDPVWFNRGVVVPPESPQNVLGSRWLGFDIPGYGIHGTIEPETIGGQLTAGCVRMRNPDVEELYSIIPMGTQVVVVD